MDSKIRAQEILEKARKKIYETRGNEEVTSLFLLKSGKAVTKTTTIGSDGTSAESEIAESYREEFSVEIPSLLKIVECYEACAFATRSKIILKTVARGDAVERGAETFVNGQRMDLTGVNEAGKDSMVAIPSSYSGKGLTRTDLDQRLRLEFFPLLLKDPWSESIELSFVAMAEADSKSAFVLELNVKRASETEAKRAVRFFFDSNSHLLLMLTDECEDESVIRTERRYYSGHRLTEGILIPSKEKRKFEAFFKKPIEAVNTAGTNVKQVRITDWEIDKFDTDRRFSSTDFRVEK